jgi:hypothetical protein
VRMWWGEATQDCGNIPEREYNLRVTSQRGHLYYLPLVPYSEE